MIYQADFLQRIVEWVAHPIFVKDRSFRYVLVNRALCELSALDEGAMLGKTDYELFAREHADAYRQKDEELFRSGAAVDTDEEWLTSARGDRHILATTKVPLRDPSGQITHLVGIIHDITQLKQAEDALRRANEELELRVASRTSELEAAQHDLMRKERLAVLGQLAGGVAHQIRNPLAAIKNAAYVIEHLGRIHLRDDASRAALGDALKVIHDEVNGANQTITALLDHARVRHAHREPVAVYDILDAVLAASTIPSEVVVELDIADLPEVVVDFDQVKGALLNVVQNAVEAMPFGGRLHVLARREEGFVAVRFRDTGRGIDPNVRERLFEPLASTKPLGLGLGLVTARTLLVGQGGQLSYEEPAALESTRETSGGGIATGATFCVRLPYASSVANA